MRLFNVPEASRLTGWLEQTIRNHVSTGLLKPAVPGKKGSTVGHKFGLVQVLSLASAMKFRDLGAPPSKVAVIIKFLGALTLEFVEAEMAAGRTYPMEAALLQEATKEEG